MAKAKNVAYKKAGGLTTKEDADGQVVEVTEEWFVRVDFGDEADVAMAASGLPANNAPHPSTSYNYLRVASREPTRQDNGIIFDIRIVYKIVNIDSETYRLVHIEYGTHEIQQDVLHNLGTGEVLVDANGKPFQQTMQVSRSYPFIKIVKKQQTSSRNIVLSHSGSINSEEVTVAGVTIPAWCGRLRISAIEQENEPRYSWEISMEVQVRYFQLSNYLNFEGELQDGPDEVGWMEGIINQGFYYYNGGTDLTRATEIVEKASGGTEERPSATPVLLDSDGTRLAEGQTPLSILLQVYPTQDWSGLGLNQV